jgi:hypothetical protein
MLTSTDFWTLGARSARPVPASLYPDAELTLEIRPNTDCAKDIKPTFAKTTLEESLLERLEPNPSSAVEIEPRPRIAMEIRPRVTSAEEE